MLRVLFYNCSTNGGNSWLCLNTAALQLKTYIDLLHPEIKDQIEWLLPLQNQVTGHELVKICTEQQVDFLCTSHYIWNNSFLMKQLKMIKSKMPKNLKIIAGGPSIDVHLRDDFFIHHPFIDYAVYGPGEQAFADIITSILNDRPLYTISASNCAWKNTDTGKQMLAPYKYVKMLPQSPYIVNEQYFTQMVEQEHATGRKFMIPYELTRGCPYSCTFCDWNSGLGTKVSRRKNVYQQDIDLFEKLRVQEFYLSDANVGQYDEDVDMIAYFAKKNRENNAGFLLHGNFSKLRKDNNLKCWHMMCQAKLINNSLSMAIQDTNPEILENINRPDVGWEFHSKIIDELTTTYPWLHITGDVILGLPGQNPTNWRQSLGRICSKKVHPGIMISELLGASPASLDPAYQEKYQFKYVVSKRVSSTEGQPDFEGYIPKSCVSFTQEELVEMAVIGHVYCGGSLIKLICCKNGLPSFNIESLVDAFLNSENIQVLKQNLYANWSKENKFYYTVNFDGTPAKLPVCSAGHFRLLGGWFATEECVQLVKKHLPTVEYQDLWQRLHDEHRLPGYAHQVAAEY